MPLDLTPAELTAIANGLFLLRDPASIPRVAKPQQSTSWNPKVLQKLELIRLNPKLLHLGVGVVDFTDTSVPPKIWLHNPEKVWRLASTAKIGMLLAAVQLRDDVRWVKKNTRVKTAQEFDELFALPSLWAKSSDKRIQRIGDKTRSPRISTIFDFDRTPDPNHVDPNNPNNELDFETVTPGVTDVPNIMERLEQDGRRDKSDPKLHTDWTFITNYDVSERLWLAGARSDNVAASTCVSEIGVDYITAVQRAYGLYDLKVPGMRFLLGSGYGAPHANIRVRHGSNATYRPFQNIERQEVIDALRTPAGRYTDQQSTQGGTAVSLLALLIALMQTNLVKLAPGAQLRGQQACNTIVFNLSGERQFHANSLVAQGVGIIADVTRAVTKVGLLGPDAGEHDDLNTDFAYLETKEKVAPAKAMQYGIVATGITGTPAGVTPKLNAEGVAMLLGTTIHDALANP